ncbi:glycoside hydrolase family 3 N-terminal domain-containing protein [Burkholderia sp. SRS-W-2-2016]|uniref:glycoside hydrolase family 3 N-terminal domain-containing protein n=1 Tax=Burkholderia sp. SRS-W-2-2016 TaxID=1926878 RepID=UPI000B17AC35|nr:glycoside hydrolase family 3 N-terminal domain-containing protein [Burkholderia sp. SRS-W-2-2016]
MQTLITIALTLLAVPALCTATPLPTADELRSLFVVENPPLDAHLFGALLIRNQLDVKPDLACTLRQAHPTVLILSDQEGGVVRNLKNQEAPPPAWDAAAMTPAAFSAQVERAGTVLVNACIDVDNAPVAEVFDKDRSYSNDPRQAAVIAARFANAMQSAGVAPVLKHYPGKLASCKPVSLLPGFQLRKGSHEVENCPGIAADVWAMADAFPLSAAPIVMLSNRIYLSVSPLPAVLDPVYTKHLRAAGYRGLVMSDALWEISNRPQTVVQALKSVDVVVLSQPRQVDEAIPFVLDALQVGTLNPDDMRAKLDRVASFKAAAIARRTPSPIGLLNITAH